MEPEDRIQALYLRAETSAESAFRPTVPVSRYLRSLDSMAQIYKVYVDARKLEEAYVLQIKMVVLFIKHLKTHPEYQKHANQNPKDGKWF